MFEWLPWIVLAALALFGMGWLVARIDIKQLLIESRAMPQSYFKGLNFLMNEQQDKAIEAFIEVTKANPEAIELQFTLGSLFRRRGEVDRAIRMHQELSERSNTSAEHRAEALLELARDYQKAGLLDHAERILLDLNAKPAGNHKQQAETLQLLLEIHVQERAWQKAIDVAARLDTGDPVKTADGISKRTREIAHYACELAVVAQREARSDDAARHLDGAVAANARCVRANMLRGDWLAAAGKHQDAIAAWRKIEQQNPDYLGLVAEPMFASFEAIGQSREGLDVLRGWQQQYPALDVLSALFKATLENGGAVAAYELVKDDLRRNPTLVGLDRLLEAQLLSAPEDRRADLQVLKNLVHSHAHGLAVYLCGQCGFKARHFFWQCPACSGWETFPPRLTAEYDMSARHLAHAHVENAAAQ